MRVPTSLCEDFDTLQQHTHLRATAGSGAAGATATCGRTAAMRLAASMVGLAKSRLRSSCWRFCAFLVVNQTNAHCEVKAQSITKAKCRGCVAKSGQFGWCVGVSRRVRVPLDEKSSAPPPFFGAREGERERVVVVVRRTARRPAGASRRHIRSAMRARAHAAAGALSIESSQLQKLMATETQPTPPYAYLLSPMMWPPKKGASSTTTCLYSTLSPSTALKPATSPACGACTATKVPSCST